jgi:serine/threonine protein kinase
LKRNFFFLIRNPQSAIRNPQSNMPELKLENSLVDGRFEVRQRLSRGSYAEIFVARDREARGREVVIKALNTSLQGTPDTDLERTLVENFQNEAIALDTVRHPNVILRWGHGTAADLLGVPFHYLVLEYMPGGDLLRLCREMPNNALPLEDALYFFKQACEALAFAHSRGIIHRDLKPNNFLLSADRRTLKIADFGVAKIAGGEEVEITRVGADIYAPPEHNPYEASSQTDRLTVSADIYSLAKSFYTVICGRAPGKYICDPIISLTEEMMRRSWGGPLTDVLRRATDDEPARRHATVVEFWNDLANTAAIAEDLSTTVPEEETIVRPRLKIVPGEMPKTPLQPDFETALASPGSHASFSTAEPITQGIAGNARANGPERVDLDRQGRRPSKFFVDLQKPQPAPPIQLQESPAPVARGAETRPAGTSEIGRPNEKETKAAARSVNERFSENLRRRIFIAMLFLAFFGSVVSVYNFWKGGATGIPTEIEVVTLSQFVRTGPSDNDAPLGRVAKGSRHKVLAVTPKHPVSGNSWMKIEVSKWETYEAPGVGQNSGWVYGDPVLVRVVSRRWW